MSVEESSSPTRSITPVDFLKKYSRSLLFVLLVVKGYLPAVSQEVHGRPDTWFTINTLFHLKGAWSLHNELHFRYDDYLKTRQQFLIRQSMRYSHKNLSYTAGFTLLTTYPYGKYPLPIDQPERNIWEQVSLVQKLGKVRIQHRYRLEHRWQSKLKEALNGEYQLDGFTFSNRFRYRLSFKQQLTQNWSFHLFDELWIRDQNGLKKISFDRNWWSIGATYRMHKVLLLEVAYLNQYIQNSPKRFERHHTLQVTTGISI